VDAWLTGALEALAALGPLRYLVAAVGMFCETSLFIGLLVPGDTIVLFTSTANRGVLDWLLLLVSVVVGSLAGESVGFAIGRWFGPRLRRTRLGRRIGERQWERSERWIERRGGFAVFLSRFLPVLHALVPVTVGMSDFAYRRFLAWTAPACVLWAVIYVSAGTAAGSSYRALSHELHSAAWIVLGAVVLFLVAIALGKRVLHRFERRTTKHR
jgi:membrane protein DedA with SNARE-associated domain